LVADHDREYVAKFSASECGVSGLVREALSAMLAADVGLPVPEPVLVKLEQGFTEALPNVEHAAKSLIERSIAPAFGSTLLPTAFFTVLAGLRIEQRLIDQAAEIFAFDALMLNPDRRAANANCKFNGNTFAIYDHDLALIAGGVGTILNPCSMATGGSRQFDSRPGRTCVFSIVESPQCQP
jgi:hypothetical protein